MIKIKKVIPKSLVNYGKHLPEAVVANIIFGFPSKKIQIIGVTGTDGKTTTVNMIYQILKDAGFKVSMISTIKAVIAGQTYDTGFHVTSPRAQEIQRFLSLSVKAHDEFMVLEVTSHALDQFRVWGINFAVGVITNITHEHLDYHGTLENYVQTKSRLLENSKMAVLNLDDPSYPVLAQKAKNEMISFGLSKKALVNPLNFAVNLKIPGDYNLYNALAAAAVTKYLGVNESVIRHSLESFKGLVGRMEMIENDRGIKVIVDFAHTPHALEEALKTLQKEGKRVIAVFGAAAERDITKRPLMGEVAAKLADIVVLTDEDPRFENSEEIMEDIAQGAYRFGKKDNKTLFKQSNREEAIKLALKLAKKGDVVGVFGKGHETSMNYQGVEREWSDQAAVRRSLQHE